jgi:hypothetical protein
MRSGKKEKKKEQNKKKKNRWEKRLINDFLGQGLG